MDSNTYCTTWKPIKNSTRWYVQLIIFETAQFWQFHPLIIHGFLPKMGPKLTWNFSWPIWRVYFKFTKKQKNSNLDHQNWNYDCSNYFLFSLSHSHTQDRGQYCLGRTKVFCRAGQVALLERLRSHTLHFSGLIIQKHMRGWIQRRRCAQWARLNKICTYKYKIMNYNVIMWHFQILNNFWFFCRYASLKRTVIMLQSLVRGIIGRRWVVNPCHVTVMWAFIIGWRVISDKSKLLLLYKSMFVALLLGDDFYDYGLVA